jgi:hypothetical protein
MQERVTFDHYRVCQGDDGALIELGRGAAGVTFKAMDVNLESPAALKVLNADLFRDNASRAAFAREARAAAKLRHRHIASVYHLGSDDDHFFYAMELVEGETAEALVKREGPLPPETALRIALQVARALAAANREGIVHGDIKPANLLIAADPSDAADRLFVKVIDFGMAFSLHDGLLSERDFSGTSQYASPEQLEECELDGRSDIYSLGCTLWFLLTGHPPFTRSLADILVLRGEPPWEELEQFPPVLRKLLRIMLRRNPAERPRDGIEVQRAIELCLARIERWRNVQSRVAESFDRVTRWVRVRSRTRTAAPVLLAALALIFGIVARGWLGEDSESPAPSSGDIAEASSAPAADASPKAHDAGNPLHHVALRDAAWLAVNSSHPPAPGPATSLPESAEGLDAAAEATPVAEVDGEDETAGEAAPASVKKKRVAKSSSTRKSRSKANPNPLVRVQRSVRDFFGRVF